MHELVRQQVRRVAAQVVVQPPALAAAIVARLVVLEPEVRRVIGERDQEVVMPEVLRAEQRSRLAHQRAQRRHLGIRDLQPLFRVARHPQAHRYAVARGQLDRAEVAPGEDRRVHERGERARLELARGAAPGLGLERGGELPALGQRQ